MQEWQQHGKRQGEHALASAPGRYTMDQEATRPTAPRCARRAPHARALEVAMAAAWPPVTRPKADSASQQTVAVSQQAASRQAPGSRQGGGG